MIDNQNSTAVTCPACKAEPGTWCWTNKRAGERRSKPHGSRITFWHRIRRLVQRGLIF